MGNDGRMSARPLLRVGLIGLVMTAAACTDDRGDRAAAPSTTLDAEESAFCDAWNAAVTSGEDSAVIDVLAEAPPELAAQAATVREGQASDGQSPEAEAAITEILNWTELHCQGGEVGDSRRRVAPPLDARFAGLEFCGSVGVPPGQADGGSGMVLYGRGQDPFDGPMLGLLWNPAGEGGHEGDGPGSPVTVRGYRGVAAPISVFQQTILPELGTVIAWTEGDREFGLYGRKWPMGRAEELVAIANQIEEPQGRPRIPPNALPDGYEESLSADPGVMSLLFASSPLYSLHYQGADGGTLTVSGLQMSFAEFHAFRFLTVDVEPGKVAGREALVGNAWGERGPAVVTWREPDGLVVRVVGIGVPLDTARKVAEEARGLTDAEWVALVEAESECPERRPTRLEPPRGGSPDTTGLD